ncbi:hypothetical protein [Flavobacterium sp. 3HN19-14]|uniref:hypothetical protein n=1 Tax=Flavobacterium sp. 3HN19-14 TaxID=3448133 RepID=UPI003EDF561A
MLYFKVNTNGTLDTTFDTAGYKEFLTNQFADGSSIFQSGSDFLLVGTSTYFVNTSQMQEKLLIVKVNASGNTVASFGTNGSLSVDLYGGYSIGLSEVILLGNKLYVNYSFIGSFNDHGNRLLKYDIVTNQSDYTLHFSNFTISMLVENNEVFVTGYNRCDYLPNSPNLCPQMNFNIRKYDSAGTSIPVLLMMVFILLISHNIFILQICRVSW